MATLNSIGVKPLEKEKIKVPATSLAQWKLMQGVAHHSIKKKGLSPATASEFVAGQSPKGLPAHAKKPTIRLKKRTK